MGILHPGLFVFIERGCRPGDPISPYLFLLCVEILGIMIQENRLIKGIYDEEQFTVCWWYSDDVRGWYAMQSPLSKVLVP